MLVEESTTTEVLASGRVGGLSELSSWRTFVSSSSVIVTEVAFVVGIDNCESALEVDDMMLELLT